MVAACAFAILSDKKVAGVFDHTAGRSLKIAAECRGNRLQGFDGNRRVKFGGTLPELYDEGNKAYVSFTVVGNEARGHDRHSAGDFAARVTHRLVQVYDYAEQAWFNYDIQNPNAAKSFYR